MRTIVSFQSERFNTSEVKENFINPICFGDDVAHWLIGQLTAAGIETDTPGQEDFGWYFNFTLPEGEHCCVIGYREQSASPGTWVLWLERRRGLFGSVLGRRRHGISTAAIGAIHSALAHAEDISNVRWHEGDDFERGDEDLGTTEP